MELIQSTYTYFKHLSHLPIYCNCTIFILFCNYRYNPHDMAVLKRLPFEDVAKFYEGLIYFSDSLENEFQEIKLTPGLIIFLDNWRVLHGRTAFTGFRHLCGAYISRSDWLSRARTLGLLQELD